MDAETFSRRLKVGALIVGLIFVAFGLIKAAEWMLFAIQVVR